MKNRENLLGGVGDYVNGVMHRGIHRRGGDKCVDSVDKFKKMLAKGGRIRKMSATPECGNVGRGTLS